MLVSIKPGNAVYINSFNQTHLYKLGYHSGSDGKESARNAEDSSSIPRSGRCPGEGNGDSFQYSVLENSMDREAWWATVHGFTKRWTQQRD